MGGNWPAWLEDEYQRLCEYRVSLTALRNQARQISARVHNTEDMVCALDDEIASVTKRVSEFSETVDRIEREDRDSFGAHMADMRRSERLECAA
ncbi:hypothetical protein [Komagataeibacter phage phiKX1]|nr:hypothetical protein [Komagataeibacter phage phiKX1]BCZ76186.1 hypothetical protein [Komagataeibacter phage phiKX2]